MHSDSSQTPNFSVPETRFEPGVDAVSETGTELRFAPNAADENFSEAKVTPAGAASGLKDVGYFSLQ